MAELLLGPLLRHVDDTCATVWVETDVACTVEVLGHSARTFHVAGHHYALVAVRGLPPGSSTAYEVHLDGTAVWPPGGHDFPPSTIRTIPHRNDTALRLLFGSCHFGGTEDPKKYATLGIDALAAYGRRMAGRAESTWPDALLLLGDQVYADELTPEVQRQVSARRALGRPRGPGRPPADEVADFEEYTYLYRHSWNEPHLRWMLSTVPTMMIFDDHDVRDDWNISRAWRAHMARLPWWSERLAGALISYWLYQHIGNLGPDELERDELYQQVLQAGRSGDAMPVLREFAETAEAERGHVKGMRWSYRRDLGPARLIVIDSRAGRILDAHERAMLSEQDFEWLERGIDTPHEHLLLASSLPWLLPHAIHHAQSWNEAVCRGRGRWARLGEWLRQLGDLEHWAAFRGSFDRLSRLVAAAAGTRSRTATPAPDTRTAPSTVCMLSGDVHHSYLAEARYRGAHAPVVQVTCSPVHNAVSHTLRGPLRMAWSPVLAGCFRLLARRAGVAPLPVRWSKSAGPYFGNMVGVLDLHGSGAEVRFERIEDAAGRWSTLVSRRLS
ncbi:alkaline phosphatase D family protein [Halopolyspora algeriensis]|uniref:alkaline phosphatase D family protein n=1 Tax=Halopolyspora algeriensis TaxID=1500506 RepID=UPI0013145788|nr:alkaline phosphatase D family protein [Halopolyspora algeriensis]